MSRTLGRLAVVAATSAVALTGVAVASATTSEHNVEPSGDLYKVTVTFNLDEGQYGDVCGAVVTPPQKAAGIGLSLASGDLREAFNTLNEDPDVHVLWTQDRLPTPVTFPSWLPIRGFAPGVVAAEVPAGVYTLISICASDATNPNIQTLSVGTPAQAAVGSMESFSSEGSSEFFSGSSDFIIGSSERSSELSSGLSSEPSTEDSATE